MFARHSLASPFCLSVPAIHTDDTQKAVSEQYHDYPYPAYDDTEKNGDRAHFIQHTECHRGECHTLARNHAWLNWYMFTVALNPLSHYLYKVS